MPTATKLMNSKRRVIFQSDRGAFFVKEGEKKLYGVKATFKKMPKGAVKKMTVSNLDTVPLAIRPMKRGAPKGPRPGAMLKKMNTESRKKTFKVVSPGGTVYKTKRQADIAAFLRRLTQDSPKK
jgi:hypothetical protein|tara:strand:- start:723 stop:1094 length:372 start_codon:yes stop_codon:yes gene_type:complete